MDLFKKLNQRTIYEMISLYEFVALFGLSFVAIGANNTYAGALALALLGKQIPEKLMKFKGYKLIDSILQNKDHSINDRPSIAFDCNMINKGGDASHNPGFPSGHSTVASFLFFVTLYNSIDLQKNENKNMFPTLALFSLFFVLVPYARYKIGCHTLPQVIGGIITGLIWASLFITLDKEVLSKNERFAKDKKKFLDFFVV